MTASEGAVEGVEGLSKKEKGLWTGQQCGDCREEGSIRGLYGLRKNTIKN